MKKKHELLIHITFWVYIIIQGLSSVLFAKSEPHIELLFAVSVLVNILIFYIFYYFIFDLFFKWKSKILVLLLALVVVLAYSGFRLIIYFIINKYIILTPPKELYYTSWQIMAEFRVTIVTAIYASLLKFTVNWFNDQQQKAELKNQNQSSEIALLRSQINPHFLFNTLNNIYSLVYQKSEEAPRVIMKLSEIMRYMLYDANTDSVPLDKELNYLRSFIELQEIRLSGSDFVELKISGSIENINIPPMLLIPFIENAFKHGYKNVQPPGIKINVSASKQKLVFDVINYCKKNESQQLDKTGGIGLHNVKRRLDLLFPEKHSLEIRQENDMYFVKLELML